MKIIITKKQKQILESHAQKEKPYESCAILFGLEKKKEFLVKNIFLTKNIDQSPVSFTISAEERLEADKMEKEHHLRIIGIFHSHPISDAYPSTTDKKFMELNPVIWVIFSGETNEFKAYILNKEIKEIPIDVT